MLTGCVQPRIPAGHSQDRHRPEKAAKEVMSARQPLALTDRDRATLRYWSGCDDLPRRAQRAQIVLLAAEGLPDSEIALRLGLSRPAVLTWRGRYARGGLPALADRPRSGRPRQVSVADVVTCTLRTAPRLRSATSCARWVAADLGISPATVSRSWRTARINVAGSGAVLYESEPPVALTELEIVAVSVHGTSGVVILQPRPDRTAPPRRRRWVHLRAACAAQICELTAGVRADVPLTAIVAGDMLGTWSRLDAAAGGLSWHISPSMSSWLAMVEGAVRAPGVALRDPPPGGADLAAVPDLSTLPGPPPVLAPSTGPGGLAHPQPSAIPGAPAPAGRELGREIGRLLLTPPGIRGWHLWVVLSTNL